MGCFAAIAGIVAGIWALREFANEGATAKAWGLTVFAALMYAGVLIESWIERRYPPPPEGPGQ
jgi:hypothetical protein